jgi:hypothetical protein
MVEVCTYSSSRQEVRLTYCSWRVIEPRAKGEINLIGVCEPMAGGE